MRISQAEQAYWNKKLLVLRDSRKACYGHNEATVKILSGNPSDKTLIDFADNWHYNFGGSVKHSGTLAFVKVYID